MKKFLLVFLAACMVLAGFTACSSCSRRGEYEEQLEEQTTVVYEHPLSEEYATPTIHKSGNTAYYADKSVDDLESLYLNSSHSIYGNPMMFPIGAVYQNSLGASGESQMYFYNKMTGNISAWCADPLCTHELAECVWSDAEILYIGTEEIIFQSRFDGNTKLYICDLQRNNVQEIYDIAEYYVKDKYGDGYLVYFDMIVVDYVYEDHVYVEYKAYSEDNAGVTGIYTIDLKSMEFEMRFEIPKTVSLLAWIEDSIYYMDSSQSGKIFRADLNLENEEFVTNGDGIAAYTERYLVINQQKKGDRYPAVSCVYDLQTKKTYDLPDNLGNTCTISEDYIYYERNLTESEMENDPMKDYYTWKWEYKKKPMNAQTQGAGKIYRVKIGENKEECVLQLTYKDVPVRIDSITADGEVVYFSYHHYEQFKNYLNQDFADSSNEPLHYAVADLQNGTVKVLDFSNAE